MTDVKSREGGRFDAKRAVWNMEASHYSHSDTWEERKLHLHACIPDARRDNGQIENSDTWDFFLQLL